MLICRFLVPDQKKEETVRLLWMLGLAMTIPMILVSGPIAGYFISIVLIDQLKLPPALTPILMSLGLAGSAYQAYRLIRKMNTTKQR